MTPKKRNMPLVAICGRPNVGKSTLFNRIIGRQHAIVHKQEGITRDRSYGLAEWKDRRFRIVDTGGIVEKPSDDVVREMQRQVRAALDEAKVVLFVVDGQQEITRIDEELRDELYRLGKPVVLAVNKLDNDRLALNRTDFYTLGIGDPIAVSSGHGLGIEELLDAVIVHLPEQAPIEEAHQEPDVTKVAIVGRPNVGKSSFVNALLNEERIIVHETPGTTRDAIDTEFQWQEREYLLIDTAGMRRKARISEDVEHFSIARALRAVRRADVCLVMLEATEGLAEQDARILGYVQEQGAGMILVWTKWDLVENKEARLKQLADEVDLNAPFTKYVPTLTISNKTRQRLFRTLEYVDRVAVQTQKRIPTAELNDFIEETAAARPPTGGKRRPPKIRYATQAGVKPTTFVLFVNQKRLFHFSYLRYIENRIRERYDFEGVPIRLELREGKPRDRN